MNSMSLSRSDEAPLLRAQSARRLQPRLTRGAYDFGTKATLGRRKWPPTFRTRRVRADELYAHC